MIFNHVNACRNLMNSLLLLSLISCGGGSSEDKSVSVPTTPPPTQTPTPETFDDKIKLNQLGYLPSSTKIAIVPNVGDKTFNIINTANNSEVFSGSLSALSWWPHSGENVSIANFSQLTIEGDYILQVEGLADSSAFVISHTVFANVHDAALKAFYFNRASTELLAEFAGVYQRNLGHPDTSVEIHQSAASNGRPAGTKISAPKGWYDAGDYGKYVVNSGIATYTLLAAFEHFPAFYQNRDLNIPESSDDIPDILNEIKWNLDWLVNMQDPADGGVYHKLTTLQFSGSVMPEEANEQRYVVQKSTAAALNFSAVMAVSSRIFQAYDIQFPGLSQQYKQSALNAWLWAKENNNVVYVQPDDVNTGQYGDATFNDEFSWAAAELYLLTQDEQYLAAFNQYQVGVSTPNWSDTRALAYISLLTNGEELLSTNDYTNLKNEFTAFAQSIVGLSGSAYQVPLQSYDFVWGSNAVVLNKAILLLQAYELTLDESFKTTAIHLVDYIFGRNPTDYSFVTGYGFLTPKHIHHRQSEADNIEEPVPGFIAGGAQNGQQDGCQYPSDLPAKSYSDTFCSYSTNEIAINWNAPLVYVLAAIQSL